MRVRMLHNLLLSAAVLTVGIASAASDVSGDEAIVKRLTHEVRMYPQYTIWDNITFRVQGGKVELFGAVSQPYKKDDLSRLAHSVPGVASVTNDLKVLPLSSTDDRLRVQVARAVYGSAAMQRYGMQPLPPIHILVENGHVTLEGVVANSFDKQIAGMRAASAGLSFSVTNNLQVESPSPKKG
jgi:hyperosmotically inducible periplasmic protein